jgi:hypothetical protein
MHILLKSSASVKKFKNAKYGDNSFQRRKLPNTNTTGGILTSTKHGAGAANGAELAASIFLPSSQAHLPHENPM